MESSETFPDFRNLGVIARTLLGVNLLALLACVFSASELQQVPQLFVSVSVFLEPLLLSSLVALHALSAPLQRQRYAMACTLALLLVLGLAAVLHALVGEARMPAPNAMLKVLVLTSAVFGLLIGYFRLLTRAYSPALAEARLQALQARIRPHFLFNSLNAVLSLIRRDPKQAERALEDLADLFRSMMSDTRRFVRLTDEIVLLERYASLEQLRLGDRLRIRWDLGDAPADAMLPSLILQPLLENAIYHGVEPGTQPGDVLVQIGLQGDRIQVRIENPYHPESSQRPGNRMALENIRERLQLFYDAEARITNRVDGGRYCVDLLLPYRHRQDDSNPT